MARFVMRRGKLTPIEDAGPLAKAADNGEMRSTAVGCPRKREQAARLRKLSAAGVDARYDPRTGQLVYQGGYHAQRAVAKLSGLEID